MNKIFLYISVLLFCLTSSLNAFAQDEIKKDTSAIDVTYFKENIKERYSGSSFDYSSNDSGGVNLIQAAFRKFFNWLDDTFGIDIDVDYETLEIIVYVLLGGGALYLLIKFLLQSPVSSIFKNEDRAIDSIHFTEESLVETDFETLINKALKKKNYRLATRYLYLKSLQLLSKKQLINWNYDKTNNEYINEIKNTDTKQLFKRISYVYDYVWYGEFPIDEENYQQNELVFNKLNTNINNG